MTVIPQWFTTCSGTARLLHFFFMWEWMTRKALCCVDLCITVVVCVCFCKCSKSRRFVFQTWPESSLTHGQVMMTCTDSHSRGSKMSSKMTEDSDTKPLQTLTETHSQPGPRSTPLRDWSETNKNKLGSDHRRNPLCLVQFKVRLSASPTRSHRPETQYADASMLSISIFQCFQNSNTV